MDGNDSDFTSPSVEVAQEKDTLEAQKDADLVALWVRELDLALRREKGFRATGREVVRLYESELEKESQFNILYSNTETLAPAMYNSTPRPVCERRFKDEDKLGKASAEAVERVLEYLIDPGESEYSSFDNLMSAAVLEALLPGRGVTWFKYDPTFSTKGDVVTAETVCGEEVPWERFRHGYAKKWPQVPWVAREHLLSKEEAVELVGKECADKLTYNEVSEMEADSGSDAGHRKDDAMAGAKLAQVFEIWDKATKRVLFIAPGYNDRPCKVVPDPLQLQAFFPCPEPLRLISTVSSLMPVALYKTYKEQAKELNLITVRINKLVAMCKVRGLYDGQIKGMGGVLTSADGVLTPVDNVAALQGMGQTLDKALWLVPIEKIITVIQQLYLARDQIKQTIYEITGIADIMRGASNASETLGAQEIKNQWGTLRLKRAQKRVAQYVRESLRIMAEIAITKFSPETLSLMTGLPWPTPAQQGTAKMQAQEAQLMGQPVSEDVQSVVEAFSWGQILDMLRSDLHRSYRIDIETNSTVDAEATEDKQNITDLINAMAQFMNGVAPLVESGSMPFALAKNILLTIVRRFRFGPELEDSLEGMQPPQPKPDPKAEALKVKADADAKASAQTMQQAQEKHAMDMQAGQAKFESEKAKAQGELGIKQQEAQIKREELELKRQDMLLAARLKGEEMQRKAQLDAATHGMKMRELEANTHATLVTAAAKAKQANAPRPSNGGK